VVGVVPDVVQTLGEPPLPTLYVPVAQHPPPLFSLIIHAPHSNLATIRREAQSAFAAIYRDKVPPEIYTVSDIVALKTQTQRFAATLLGMLALVPLLLAISGIYGVVSFSVTQRSREFGVRVALGARAAGILRDVLRRALLTSAIGVALGTVLAALDAQAITPYLMARPDFSASFAGIKPRLLVSPFDPLTFGVVIALIFACTAVAALIPALRATRVDPVVLLRYE
jgi:putative ABC transport system permease protein